MSEWSLIVGLLLGAVVGAAVVWSWMRAKSAGATERFTAQQAAIDQLHQRESLLQAELLVQRSANTTLEREKAELDATLRAERKQTVEKLAHFEQAEQTLKNAFESLAAQALNSNNKSFLDYAKEVFAKEQETAKGDLEKRQMAVGQLVAPVKDALVKVEEKLQALESKREGAYEGLLTQVKTLQESEHSLRKETANLVNALRSPTVRGRWGEMQLERVVEMAGMLEHCHFEKQVSTDTEDGRLRPDLIVRLPGNRTIVVDAKAPLAAFLEAIDADDEGVKRERLKDHARSVRNHLSCLSKKSYWDQFSHSPDFVVLFLPGETFFSAALEHEPALIEVGVEQRVMIATPTTLITLLRTVALGWRQETLARSAQEISTLGKMLYERLATVADHMRRLGKNLQASVKTYNEAVGTLESRVLVSARKFRELGAAGSADEIEEVEPLEISTRDFQRLELFDAAELSPAERPVLETRS